MTDVAGGVLDNLPWHALTGPQAAFAEGPGPALRYRPSVGVFSAAGRLDRYGWQALADMTGPGRAFVLFQADPGDLPPGVVEVGRWPSWQMVADSPLPGRSATGGDVAVAELGPADADEMVALTALAQPGPFGPETYRLGTYLGVRGDGGRLLAMAGERMRTGGVSEISAVCTHPDARRRGLGAELTAAMVELIAGRGELPVLHVVKTNVSAIALYQRLGFRTRRTIDAVAARVVPADRAGEVSRHAARRPVPVGRGDLPRIRGPGDPGTVGSGRRR